MVHKSTVEKVEASIYAATAYEEPWLHYLMPNVFPFEYYQLIRGNLPPIEDMQPLNSKTTTRYLYWLKKKNNPVENVAPFWKDFILGLFEPIFHALSTRTGARGFDVGAELVYDLPGYRLGPHTDTPDKLITCLFYLPDMVDFNDLDGTVLYRGKQEDPAGKGHKLTSDYTPEFKVRYLPNTGMLFERANWSFHGVEKVTKPRWTLAFDIFRE